MLDINKTISALEASQGGCVTPADLLALLKLVQQQHAIIAELNHHSEFAGDCNVVDAITAYEELTGGAA